MNKIFNDILTGKDNETYDIARVLWAIGFLVYLGLSISASIQNQPWRPMEFGTGLGSILAAGGFGVYMKRNTEPNKDD